MLRRNYNRYCVACRLVLAVKLIILFTRASVFTVLHTNYSLVQGRRRRHVRQSWSPSFHPQPFPAATSTCFLGRVCRRTSVLNKKQFLEDLIYYNAVCTYVVYKIYYDDAYFTERSSFAAHINATLCLCGLQTAPTNIIYRYRYKY